eukprot:scaffold2823_cov118-Isochrysis_galbana.AAC.7
MLLRLRPRPSGYVRETDGSRTLLRDRDQASCSSTLARNGSLRSEFEFGEVTSRSGQAERTPRRHPGAAHQDRAHSISTYIARAPEKQRREREKQKTQGSGPIAIGSGGCGNGNQPSIRPRRKAKRYTSPTVVRGGRTRVPGLGRC